MENFIWFWLINHLSILKVHVRWFDHSCYVGFGHYQGDVSDVWTHSSSCRVNTYNFTHKFIFLHTTNIFPMNTFIKPFSRTQKLNVCTLAQRISRRMPPYMNKWENFRICVCSTMNIEYLQVLERYLIVNFERGCCRRSTDGDGVILGKWICLIKIAIWTSYLWTIYPSIPDNFMFNLIFVINVYLYL